MQTIDARILLIEDDGQIRRLIQTALVDAGMVVYEAANAVQGLAAASKYLPDVVIVDLGLPDKDGTVLIKELRLWSLAPIIILSARHEEIDKIKGLDAGADDYLTKPLSLGELFARLRAQLRRQTFRQQKTDNKVFRFGTVEIDFEKRWVLRAQQPVSLTPIEFKLLSVLVRNAGCVVTQRQLLKDVWGPTFVESSHYLRIYMGHLRHKLEAVPERPQYLMTEVGIGYRLLVDGENG